MQTFDQHLMDLVSESVVTYETALASSSNPADFELQMRTLRRRTMSQPAPVLEPEGRVTPEAEAAPDRPAGFTTDDLSDLMP
jgi:hypothetical protein